MLADGFFSSKLGLIHCHQLLLNDLQDCYEPWCCVKIPYWDVHIVRNLCLGKSRRNLWRYFRSDALSTTPP